MSELLNHRSLGRARQLMTFRISLMCFSLTFFSLGSAAILVPAADSLTARFGRQVASFALGAFISVWLYLILRLFIECLNSIEGLEDVLPRLNRLLQKIPKIKEIRLPWWRRVVTFVCVVIFVALGQWLALRCPIMIVEDPMEWAVFWMASAIVAGALVPVLDYLRNESASQALQNLAAAVTPQYERIQGSMDDASLFQLYRDKSSAKSKSGFALDNLPVFLCLPSAPEGYAIEGTLLTKKNSVAMSSDSAVSESAALRGLDWTGFARWRQREEEVRYLWDHRWEEVFALASWELSGSTIRIEGTCASYLDFLIRDKSADLFVEGVLLRDILEQPAWNNCGFDLANISSSRGHYAYTVGVNGLYCTKDGFLVLQRRARGLQTGGGNLGASVAGTLQIEDIGIRPKFQTDAVLRGLLRETREELGIMAEEVSFAERPCTGMGLNLRHGRDPNFYFFGELELIHAHISKRRWAKRISAPDAWEWDHLVFVPIEAVDNNGALQQPLDQLLGGARHLRAALHAMAKNAKFCELRDRWKSQRGSKG